ncbi:unnamed protein product [Rotaria magnacalcarata]|uniref:Uncharacterized protein n=1 Tax=Rotaria magnacalcarata TaxID=392030 RepID=A0A8S3HHH6_9BILA|nr:unnamed protein product [Rotaria magnacalcarata]CAF5190164.1 unnamed protein product [Rotaria magnacalcarata]
MEYNATSPVRSSRSSSIEKQSQQRERSSSIRRVQIEKDDEHELQQRITTTNIGFRKDFLPD